MGMHGPQVALVLRAVWIIERARLRGCAVLKLRSPSGLRGIMIVLAHGSGMSVVCAQGRYISNSLESDRELHLVLKIYHILMMYSAL